MPSTSTPMPTYWPGWWSNDQPQPGRITRVAAVSVSRTTFSTRPRSSRVDHSGLISCRKSSGSSGVVKRAAKPFGGPPCLRRRCVRLRAIAVPERRSTARRRPPRPRPCTAPGSRAGRRSSSGLPSRSRCDVRVPQAASVDSLESTNCHELCATDVVTFTLRLTLASSGFKSEPAFGVGRARVEDQHEAAALAGRPLDLEVVGDVQDPLRGSVAGEHVRRGDPRPEPSPPLALASRSDGVACAGRGAGTARGPPRRRRRASAGR